MGLQKQQRSTTKIICLVLCPTYIRVPQSDTIFVEFLDSTTSAISGKTIKLQVLETGFEKLFFMLYCLYSSYTAILILALCSFTQSYSNYQQLYAITIVIRLTAIESCFRTYYLVRVICQKFLTMTKKVQRVFLGHQDCFLLGTELGKYLHGLVYIIKNERNWASENESFKYACVQVNTLSKNIKAGRCRMYFRGGEQFILLEYENNQWEKIIKCRLAVLVVKSIPSEHIFG